jgi:hypothetical protein
MLSGDRHESTICRRRAAPMPEPDLPLPDPFPEYVTCTHCGEPEVEVWCYQARVQCHACGGWMDHPLPHCFGMSAVCRAHSPG